MLNGTILPTKVRYSQSDSGAPVEYTPCNFAKLLVVLSSCFHTSFTFSNPFLPRLPCLLPTVQYSGRQDHLHEVSSDPLCQK